MAIDYSDLPLEQAVRVARTNSRRRQLLDAAVKVMQKTGFHQTSMQDLATEANVSVGLIYKYFGGKEDLLLATISGSSTRSAISSAGHRSRGRGPRRPVGRGDPSLHRDRRREP